MAYRDLDSDIGAYIKLANKHPLLTHPEERALLIKFNNPANDRERLKALDTLCKHNLGLVINQAKKYINRGLPLVDLVQEGWAGLVTGITKFDITRTKDDGNFLKLSTYVTWWIRQAITRAIANHGKTIRIPINILAEYTKVQILYGKFVEENESRPNSEDLAYIYNTALVIDAEERIKNKREPSKLTAKSADEISELGRMFQPVISLDEPSSEDDNLTLLDNIGDSCTPHDGNLEISENHRYLNKLLNQLNEEERNYVKVRFGLVDGKDRDRKTMSALRKMTAEQINQKEKAIFDKLKLYASKDKVSMDWTGG